MANAPFALDPFSPPASSLDPRSSASTDLPLASRGRRLGAALLDFVVMIPLMIVGGVLGYAVLGARLNDPTQGVATKAAMSGLMFLALLPLIIYQWVLIARRGQTLAKGWLGIKIVKLDNSDVNFVSGVVLRSWVLGAANMLGVFGSIVGLVDALAIFSDDRRTLHDRVAGTKVVKLI